VVFLEIIKRVLTRYTLAKKNNNSTTTTTTAKSNITRVSTLPSIDKPLPQEAINHKQPVATDGQEWVSRTEFAKRHGVTLAAITAAMRTGRIKSDAISNVHRGARVYQYLDFPLATKQYSETRRKGASSGYAGEPEIQNARQILDEYKAKKAKLDYEEASGELIKRRSALKFIGDVAIEHRDRMRGIPDRIIPKIYAAVLSGEKQSFIYDLLKDELDSALGDLAKKAEIYEDDE